MAMVMPRDRSTEGGGEGRVREGVGEGMKREETAMTIYGLTNADGVEINEVG